MVLKRQYFHLEERNTADVSSVWKAFHIIIFVATCVCGFMTAYSFGSLSEYFDYNCVLYADIKFVPPNATILLPIQSTTVVDKPSNVTTSTEFPLQNSTVETVDETTTGMVEETPSSPEESSNISGRAESNTNTTQHENATKILQIDASNSLWGRLYLCNFCQFTHVISMVLSIFLGAFIVITSRGGRGYASDILPSPWKLILPLLVISGVMSIIIMIASSELYSGLNAFCDEFLIYTKSKGCTSLVDEYTLQFNKNKKHFSVDYKWTVAGTYLGVSAWILQFALLLLRIFCVVDFQMFSVDISQKTHDDETESTVVMFTLPEDEENSVSTTEV